MLNCLYKSPKTQHSSISLWVMLLLGTIEGDFAPCNIHYEHHEKRDIKRK